LFLSVLKKDYFAHQRTDVSHKQRKK